MSSQKVQNVGPTIKVQVIAAMSSKPMPITTVQTSQRRDRREGMANTATSVITSNRKSADHQGTGLCMSVTFGRGTLTGKGGQTLKCP